MTFLTGLVNESMYFYYQIFEFPVIYWFSNLFIKKLELIFKLIICKYTERRIYLRNMFFI